jgi:hypothetical protein
MATANATETVLTDAQKRQFYTDGYLHLPGIVSSDLVHAACRAINASLGARGMHPDALPSLRARSYCPELQDASPITDLLHASPLWSIAESCIGQGNIRPATRAQIALRFPSMEEPHAPQPHIDGMHTPTNGIPAGEIHNFTALVGVLLSDLPHEYAGNFTVWPGTHRLYERYFRERGPQALLQGMPPVALPQPQQIVGRAGDAIFCHYQLGHGIAGNGAPHIRYAVFFRLFHNDHDGMRWKCMTDIWRAWGGMRALLQDVA